MSQYEPTAHLLAFVDALGFSHDIKRNSSDRVNDYFRAINTVRTQWSERELKRPIKVTTIGDSVILAAECAGIEENARVVCRDGAFQSKIYNLSYAVAELQSTLAIHNIWTRGAITYDFVEVESAGGGRIVGPAFHRAVHLESSVARVPRVVLDGGITEAANFVLAGEFVKRSVPLP